MSPSPALAFEAITVEAGDRLVLDAVTFAVKAKERVALIGPSGAGKSTCLRVASGLRASTGGTLRVLGSEPSALRGRTRRAHQGRVGTLLQADSLVDELRIVHNVLMGRLGEWSSLRALLSLLRPIDTQVARAALAKVELAERIDDYPTSLSGGERRRVAIARLMVQEPKLILADEPCAGLDERQARRVLELLEQLGDVQDAALVVAMHDLSLLAGNFDRVLALREGKLVWSGTPDELDAERRHAIYDRDEL